MTNRRTRLFEKLASPHGLKTAAMIYLAISLLTLIAAAVFGFTVGRHPQPPLSSFLTGLRNMAPALIGILHLIGLGFIIVLLRNCRNCQTGQGKRISTALDKMSKGDLGWKITLRRGDELAEVADSVSRASQSLAERVATMQAKVKELSGVEEFLLDSIDTGETIDPYTLKALRKMKICTSRLISDMDDFQVSTLAKSRCSQNGQTKRELTRV